MKYAPIFIPTLNRFEHFRKCLESLEKCTGAEHTEVYIALDFPPSEKYQFGWSQIDAYLRNKEEHHNFKELIVVRRERNYGVGKKDSNTAVMRRDLMERYDSIIYSEDDNVFSPNFLDYMNKGLELFRDDPTVYCICGYTQSYDFRTEGASFFRHSADMSAWGYGIWNDRVLARKDFVANDMFHKTFSIKHYLKIRKLGLNRALQYIHASFHGAGFIRLTDDIATLFAAVNNMTMIVPNKSLVRNMGWDGSGDSYKGAGSRMLKKDPTIAEKHFSQEIDDSPSFEFMGTGWENYEYNNQVTAKCSEGKIGWFEYVGQLMPHMTRYFLREIGIKKVLMDLHLYKDKTIY